MTKTAKQFSNESGIHPILNRVVVRPDVIEEKTEGGIVVPDSVADQHQMAQATGTLIAVGPDAYIHSRTEVHRVIDNTMRLMELRISGYDPSKTPKPGDRIQFAKYGGLVNIGKDGDEYRVLNDEDITCLVDEGVKYTGIESRKPVSGVSR